MSGSAIAAAFTYSPASPASGQPVQFTDTSAGTPTSWQWDFGDGSTSTAQNPSHSFATAGSKTVSLTATNGSGSNATSRTVTVGAALVAAFNFSPASPAAGQAVQFTDTSVGSPTSWQWNFGDGSTSTARNPSHSFATAGSKTVSLTATNGSGSNATSRTVTVGAALVAAFNFSPASPAAGQSVQFTDTSVGSPTSWSWNFGDGSTSTLQNPTHAFATSGSKTVTLTASKSSGSSTATRTVAVAPALIASFSYSPASPAAGQAIQFTDTSEGSPASWLWNFGDSSTSTARNPTHTYATAGSKTVSLTVTNGSRSNATSRTVTVRAALVASFNFSPASPSAGQPVQFTDTSAGNPTSWLWDFNDGATSSVQNPSHNFASSGSYSVALTVTSGSGSTSVSHIVNVAASSTLSASFTFSPASPTMGASVQFTDTSAGAPTSWQWSFGDGSTSTARNPSHPYTTAGSKTVSLTVANGSASDSVSRTVTVVAQTAIIVDHTCTTLADIPTTWINQAKQTLHIAFGHTSHGSQLTTGMTGLVAWKGTLYSFNTGGSGGALDLRDYLMNFGGLGIANDLGDPDRTAWERATRTYLNANPTVNVIIWAWCGQVWGTEAEIQLYLDLMTGLEEDYPNVKFVYMTGHTDGTLLTGVVPTRNRQIRDYCIAHNKILYDFYDIESWDPDGHYYGDKLVDDDCSYDSNGDWVPDSNWAVNWQNAHPGEWYNCPSAHSQPLNANLKAYAAWWLWARLAGWAGK